MISTFTLRKSCCVQALLLAFAAPYACSQTIIGTSDSEPVVIIGSRFPNSPDLAPIGAQVITASEIRNAGIDNVNEAIRKLGGVYGRKSSYGTQDFDLDMSGFGVDSANNLVVLVDGVRVSENEQTVALLSSIPIDSVARIEIMRGGSSVLYGDGATGGVIQIITKRLGPNQLSGSVTAEAGQFRDYAARAYLTQGGDGFNASLNLSDQQADNYRANNQVKQKNASATLTWFMSDLRAGLRIDIARQDSGLPGALSLAQFQQDPRQSLKPNDNGAIDVNRYTGFVEKNLGDWQAAAELSTRERTATANYVSLPYYSTYSGRQTEFTPRLRNTTSIDGLHNELVIGLDIMNWNRDNNAVGYLPVYATQKSKAVYLRDELKVGDARLAVGARRELFDKSSSDPNQYATDNYYVEQGVNAWELQGSYVFLPLLNGFAKFGQSYRVANVDDNAGTLLPNTPLLPQLSHDIELGATLGTGSEQLTARLFRHDITDEIFYNPLAGPYGANANLDPTRRQGVALEGKYPLSQQFNLSARAQHVNATFTAGVNDGKEMVLVPKNTLSVHVNWLSGNGQSAYLGTQWVDTQRYGNDYTNSCAALIPSHVTLDGRYAQTLGAWELAVSGSNLTDKKFFTNAYGQCQSGIYPDDGRQMKVSLRYSF
ncbi:iron complex outermembrane receptor protein [Oxalobacteraceae bacterium GrIS 2.11]